MNWPKALVLAALFFMAGPLPEKARADEGSIPVAELDRALARRVRQFLGPALAAHLEINAHDGQVTVRGKVESLEKQRVIEQKAEEITGRKLTDQTEIAVKNPK